MTRPRILFYDVNRGTENAPGNRGRGALVANIDDAGDIGVGEWVNSPGEMFFTLPTDHPQGTKIVPLQVHYSVEDYRNGAWVEVAAGLIYDMDATENEVVYKGVDYVGLLARLYEERFATTGADTPIDKGGSKYVDKFIVDVVLDQLAQSKALTASPVGFINAPQSPPATSNWQEKVTIISVFKQRLAFIAGLMDSHAAGTGKRPRLDVEKSGSNYYWRFADAAGTERDEFRMEYGSLVQGFRVIPLGATFGSKALGIGQTLGGTQPIFATGTALDEASPGTGDPFPEWYWGSFPLTEIYTDLIDNNDLKRRTALLARRAGKIGKHIGLGLLVDGMRPRDGWELLDHFPIDIQREIIDTTLYGSGYWTVIGWTWRVYRDGHTDLVLTLEPRDDGADVDLTLIASDPMTIDPPWKVGCGKPTQNEALNGYRFYYDRCSGLIWELDDCPEPAYGPYSFRETFNRTVNPDLGTSEFIMDGVTREWGVSSGPLATSLQVSGGQARVSAVTDPADTGNYAQASIQPLSDTLQTPIELLVEWGADGIVSTESRHARLFVTIGGFEFQLTVHEFDDGGGGTTLDDLSVYGPVSAALGVNAGSSAKYSEYSNLGGEFNGGAGPYYPEIDPWVVPLFARLRIERFGTSALLKAKVWAGTEPSDWTYTRTVGGWDELDLPFQPLTLRLYPFRNPTGESNAYETRVDTIELVSGGTVSYVNGLSTLLASGAANSATGHSYTDDAAFEYAYALTSGGGSGDTQPHVYTGSEDPFPNAPNRFFSDHSLLRWGVTDPPITNTGRITQFETPAGGNLLSGSITVRGLNAANIELGYSVLLIHGTLPELTVGTVDPAALQLALRNATHRVLFTGSISAGQVGLIDIEDFTFEAPITGAGFQIVVLFDTLPTVANYPTNYTGSQVQLQGTIDVYQVAADYCWEVRPPVAWTETIEAPFPLEGQIVPRRAVGVGDGLQQFFYTIINTFGVPYQPGSLRVDVDGLYQNVSETDPSTGLFLLEFAPDVGETVFAEWRRLETGEPAVP